MRPIEISGTIQK